MKGVAESAAAFKKLNETADAVKVSEWEEQERQAQQRRTTNPKVMDIYEVQLQRGISEYYIVSIRRLTAS